MAWPLIYGLDAAKFDAAAAAAPPRRPTILLVHDAFHAPAHLEPLASELRRAGFGTRSAELPSSGGGARLGPSAFEADVRAVIQCGVPELDAGRDVVVVMHGYGAVPGAVAADRLDAYSLARPRAGEVVKLVFLAGAVVEADQRYEDIHRPDWAIPEKGVLRVHHPGQVFYHDCPLEASRRAIALLRLQVASSFQTPVPRPGWQRIPSLYVILELDRAISPACQRRCVQVLQAGNRRTAVTAIQSGHSPFLSRLRETVAVILQASAGAHP